MTSPASRMMRRWWEKVDLLSSSPASCLTWAHHDSPAGAAAGILTTAQQFGAASGVAVIGAVFYTRLGVTRASTVSAMEMAMAINAVVVLAAAALTLLLPRRTAARRPAATAEPAVQEYTAEATH